jgi:hypothetical protein
VEEEERDPWLVIIAIIIAIMISIFTFAEAVRMLDKSALDYLHNKIDNMENVSDDYKKGWNDCINEFKKWMNRTLDTTPQPAKTE